jgi:ribose transport system substrate-binding protein
MRVIGKRRLLVGMAALAMAAAGCGANGSSNGDNGKVRVGYISFGESTPYVHTITQGMESAAKKQGVDLVVCDSAQDAEKALQCATRFKQQNVQGIVNYQGDASAAQRICSAGPDVPVIAITIHQPPCEVSWTGADNAAAGKLAGEEVGKFFKEKFDCDYDLFVSAEVAATGQTGIARMGGYRDGFEEICGKIHDLRPFDSKADAQVTRSNMTDILTAAPNAHRIIVVAMADAIAVGALSAAESAGRIDDVFVSSQGLDSGAVCGMRKYPKSWIGDTAYFPENYGKVVIPAILNAVKGEKIPATLPAKTEFVTPETVDQHYAAVKC